MPNDPLIFRFFITVSLLFGINVELLKLQNVTHSASQIICVHQDNDTDFVITTAYSTPFKVKQNK